jgi:hypothetical protein
MNAEQGQIELITPSAALMRCLPFYRFYNSLLKSNESSIPLETASLLRIARSNVCLAFVRPYEWVPRVRKCELRTQWT